MLAFILRTLWLLWCWIELTVFTLSLYLLAWIPGIGRWTPYHSWFRLWCSFFVRALGVNLVLHEKNQKPLPRHFIFISNHPSAFEDVGVPALFDVYPLAKVEVRSWFLVGKINAAAQTLFVKREDKESRQAAVQNMIDRLKQGHNVALFPEGGCKGRRIAPFQYGAFDISLQTGIPILPVFLHYESQDTFEWRDPQTLIHKLWHFITCRNSKANYYVYDAIYPENFSDKKAFAEHVHRMYLRWQEKYLD
ncbi:MAG: 1-acyl-sn-glycerol-3-phosphate acyltransferase [Gammaproteobacteria bacterium]|nr:1-acyl-sn-glycerol-3-phosphate acyltransferase [Gammaproteobacteria bacterium]MDH5800931.1 1-acyl-sn-glycerol-3-phosphate acyltransferase [Gammaproteobacteria bacterium]